MDSQIKNEECRSRNGFDCLPREVILDIASRLSATSVIRLRCVCKSFYSLLRGTEFVNLHLSRSVNNDPYIVLYASLNQLRFLEYSDQAARVEVQMITNPRFIESLPQFRVAGSCGGLLCIYDESVHSDIAFVYNPFTWDYIELPKSLLEIQVQYFVYGFGSHPTTNEYKVIKIMYSDNAKRSDVQLLTVGSNKWRSIGEVGYYIDPTIQGITLNGKVHWFAIYDGRYDRFIVSFDLADEVFVEIPNVGFSVQPISHLVVLRGCLAVARPLHQLNGGALEIWVMREYNVTESWAKEFVIEAYEPTPDSFIPYLQSPEKVLCMLKNGELLLEYEGGNLVSYNPQNGVFRKLMFGSVPKSLVVHVGGLNWIDIPPPDL